MALERFLCPACGEETQVGLSSGEEIVSVEVEPTMDADPFSNAVHEAFKPFALTGHDEEVDCIHCDATLLIETE